MIGGFDLAAPWVLLLLPLPLVFTLLHRRGSAEASGLRIPASWRETLVGDPGLKRQRPRPKILPWLAWACLVVALADPRRVAATPALPTTGRDIMFALDLSGSMIAEDMVMGGKPITPDRRFEKDRQRTDQAAQRRSDRHRDLRRTHARCGTPELRCR